MNEHAPMVRKILMWREKMYAHIKTSSYQWYSKQRSLRFLLNAAIETRRCTDLQTLEQSQSTQVVVYYIFGWSEAI